ncbi:MAG: hypothetical protein OXE92_03910 [Bacteroidetes bacterium]|nr:hypothetical protein [Bacteroidota bacterium]MCY4204854.1 hypothetical protein [Bacteroidota bacterium]
MRLTFCFSFSGLLLSGLLFVQLSSAQRGPRGLGDSPELQEARIDSLIFLLELTEDQIPVVRAIFSDRLESLRELRPERNGGREQFQMIRAERQKINKETEIALGVFLSPEQMNRYRRFIERQNSDRKTQMRRRGRQN